MENSFNQDVCVSGNDGGGFNVVDLAQKVLDKISQEYKSLKTLNLMVMGKSGVGKSTLINSMFREKLAETGVGRPVTKVIRKYEKKDCPLVIYDTPGLELSSEQRDEVKSQVKDIIREGVQSKEIARAIHCLWYCINVGGNRTFDKTELDFVRELTEETDNTGVPVIVVLTQAVPKSKAEEMKRQIDGENLNIRGVVSVLAQDVDFDGEYTARAFGLDTLLELMQETLPEDLQTSLQNMQKVSLEAKIKEARRIVMATVAMSFGEGFSPLPCSDAVLLIPTQISMLAAITVVFGIDINKNILAAIVSGTLGIGGAAILGRAAVANILKLIPGFGTAIGGLVSASTAGILTKALGEVYIAIMSKIFTGEMKKEDLASEKGKKEIFNAFSEQLKKK